MNKPLFQHKPHPYTPRNVNVVHDEHMSVGARIADIVANTMGSWRFIIIQTAIVTVWIALNVWLLTRPFDPYPLILLNLVFSTQAAYASPLILMSQNRQAEKDRLTADHTFQNTVKEEEETRGIIEHLAAQDSELVRQTQELLKQTIMLEAQATRLEKLLKRVDAATGRGAA